MSQDHDTSSKTEDGLFWDMPDYHDTGKTGTAVPEGVDTAELRNLLQYYASDAYSRSGFNELVDFVSSYGAQQREAGRLDGIAEGAGYQARKFDKIRQRKDARIAELEAALATRQPVSTLTDERAAFESWARSSFLMRGEELRQIEDGYYSVERLSSAWCAWQDRALLAASPKAAEVEPVSKLAAIAIGYESATLVTDPSGATINMHYASPTEAEVAFCALSDHIDAINRGACPAKVEPVGDDELHFNAQRLRNVAALVGLESAVPQDDASLDGSRGSVLGQIAAKLRGQSASAVNRFLGWPMPKTFSPDGGVTFVPPFCGWPTGTNLLSAVEARAMFEHCLANATHHNQLPEIRNDLRLQKFT